MVFKVKHKDNLFFHVCRAIVRVFRRKPTIIRLYEGEMQHPCIMIGNHSAVSGAMTYRLALCPPAFMTWAAHSMCEGYRARSKYMRKTFYRQKLGFGKFGSNVLGSLFSIVLGVFYKTAGTIPVYYDGRVKKTFEYSLQPLGEGVSVLIFPEDSDTGYFDVLEKEMHPGYLTLARLYRAKTGEDLPVYPMYYSKKKNVIAVGEPQYTGKLSETMDKNEMNEFFRKSINALGVYASENKPENKRGERKKTP